MSPKKYTTIGAARSLYVCAVSVQSLKVVPAPFEVEYPSNRVSLCCYPTRVFAGGLEKILGNRNVRLNRPNGPRSRISKLDETACRSTLPRIGTEFRDLAEWLLFARRYRVLRDPLPR